MVRNGAEDRVSRICTEKTQQNSHFLRSRLDGEPDVWGVLGR
jgi:hypothetical protein